MYRNQLRDLKIPQLATMVLNSSKVAGKTFLSKKENLEQCAVIKIRFVQKKLH